MLKNIIKTFSLSTVIILLLGCVQPLNMNVSNAENSDNTFAHSKLDLICNNSVANPNHRCVPRDSYYISDTVSALKKRYYSDVYKNITKQEVYNIINRDGYIAVDQHTYRFVVDYIVSELSSQYSKIFNQKYDFSIKYQDDFYHNNQAGFSKPLNHLVLNNNYFKTIVFDLGFYNKDRMQYISNKISNHKELLLLNRFLDQGFKNILSKQYADQSDKSIFYTLYFRVAHELSHGYLDALYNVDSDIKHILFLPIHNKAPVRSLSRLSNVVDENIADFFAHYFLKKRLSHDFPYYSAMKDRMKNWRYNVMANTVVDALSTHIMVDLMDNLEVYLDKYPIINNQNLNNVKTTIGNSVLKTFSQIGLGVDKKFSNQDEAFELLVGEKSEHNIQFFKDTCFDDNLKTVLCKDFRLVEKNINFQQMKEVLRRNNIQIYYRPVPHRQISY